LELHFAEFDRGLGDVFLEPFGVGGACDAGEESQRSFGEVELGWLEGTGRPRAKAERCFQLGRSQCQPEGRRESEKDGQEESLKLPGAPSEALIGPEGDMHTCMHLCIYIYIYISTNRLCAQL
jgi:hypothetical protein